MLQNKVDTRLAKCYHIVEQISYLRNNNGGVIHQGDTCRWEYNIERAKIQSS
jgi:hypothetical protein